MSAAFAECIKNAADNLIKEYYAEVSAKMSDARGTAALEMLAMDEENIIRRKLVGYADAVMDSFGTGSKMDVSNPALSDYKSSELWNSARAGLAIAGREKGEYKNIYGDSEISSGTMAGINLEDVGLVKAREPSYAFQNADKWFFGGNRCKETLNVAIANFFSPRNIRRFLTFS